MNRPLQDMEIAYRPLELRSLIEQAYGQRHPVYVQQVEWAGRPEGASVFDVAVMPLLDGHAIPMGAIISFNEVTDYHRLKEEVEHARQELETAYEELQSTIEELETTNEELQSTNEELETTNEELQSANEELETMNEELQSTNEELETINTELRRRTEDLNHANAFMESVLSSLRAGVAVLDRSLVVRSWNRMAEDLWGLRADEVQGKNFLNLDIGLPVHQLRQTINGCVQTGDCEALDLVLAATNRRGKAIDCRTSVSPLLNASREIEGVILLMEGIARDG
jgi:two-component system CheB/CheR fusion protein